MPKKCSLCGSKIPEDGWGKHAYCTADGSRYIHHKCRPAPAPAPPAGRAAPPEPNADYLTLPDAAKLIGVSASTLRRRIKNGSLPAFRLDGGQTLLIERAALLRLLRPL